ncbi:carboxypeptidase-like regulatory domain-containing protein [Pedobacter foliorum]|uniref:carboxypeptidase-like regulatory domain-containing protein n=1 Tax=Pedobacter foliorum TaxID=2739058 RepID=UPI00156515BF|nr:carboxypeptidase-like regulatory domain-containing protein [Pedobacter foliorum]NRF40381.1 hypothetical protein [Pedobacter foliorum]
MITKNARLLFLLNTVMLFTSFMSGAVAQIVEQEKVYIHTNKPNYNLGDTLWFKAYITQGSRNVLSALSGSVYVDLINEKDSMYRSVRLPVADGVASGDLILGDDCLAGIYRIRAYTQWMRNKSPDYFFDKSFAVSNTYVNEAKVVTSTRYEKINGETHITTKINYTDTEGKPISGKVVKYKVVSEYNTINNKSIKTDGEGSIEILVVNDERILAKKVYVEAYLRLNANNEITKIVPLNVEHIDTDVQFFPEGGNLINGVTSRIGFKAVGVNGAGVKINGEIIDDEGKALISFSSVYAGMGSFEFKPQLGKVYKAKVVFSDQSERTINFPVAVNDNFALSVSQPADDFIAIKVKAPASLTSIPSGLNLLVQSGGEQIFSSSVSADQLNSEIKVKRSLFPPGIATVTLYEKLDTPLSERVFFVKKESPLKLEITSDKLTYKYRSLVQMQVAPANIVGKLVKGSFSVSVVSEAVVPDTGDKESTILSNLLLSSDLKGYIENPNYYFNRSGTEIDGQLDNLMLTQGYRKFILNDFYHPLPPKYPAERIGVNVAGVVKTLGGKPVSGSRVTLIALNSGIMEDARTDQNGRFKVEGMMINEGVRFNVQAKSPKGGDRVEVSIDRPVFPEISINKNGPDFNDHQNQIIQVQNDPLTLKADRSRRLREIIIRAKKLESIKFTPQGSAQIPEGHADQTFVLTNPESCATLGICLQGKIHGVTFMKLENKNVINYPHCRQMDIHTNAQMLVPMDVYVDGRKIVDTVEMAEIFDGNSIDPSNIGKIEVVRTNIALINSLVRDSENGVKSALLIITKRHDKRDQVYTPNIAKFMPQGFSKSREFYSPKYEVATNERYSDLRSAVYWNPDLIPNENEPMNFNFYTSDMKGNYRVTVEGIDEEGNIGRQVFRFKVE